MGKKETILKFLEENDKEYCDDCLSKVLEIHPRQTVNSICRKALDSKLINRQDGTCSSCHTHKIVNTIAGNYSNHYNNVPYIDNSLEISKSLKEKYNSRLSPIDLEKRVGHYLKGAFNQSFIEKPLMVGENKNHKFDLVSEDNSVVVECKSYTWTESDNFPSAKISTVIEALFYLSRIRAERKIIVFQDSINARGESLVEIFIRRYNGLIDDVEIWSFDVGDTKDKDNINIKREPGNTWYKQLYS